MIQVWRCIASWLDVDIPSFSSMIDWVDARSNARMERIIIESVCMVVIWVVWTYQNAFLFSSSKPRKQLLFDSVVETSFRWFTFRNSKARINWVEWMKNSILNLLCF